MARPSLADLFKQPGRHPLGDSLYLVVARSLTSIRFEYRLRFGKMLKSYWLGSAVGHGAMTVTKARGECKRIWLENRGNGQPRQATTSVTGKTFAEGLEEWLDANPKGLAAKSVQARRVLAKTSLATLDIGKITQADVLAALAPVKETPRKHAERRGWLAEFFSYAKTEQWRAGDNPARFDADTRQGFAKVVKGDGHAHVNPADFPAVLAKLPDSEVGNAARFTALTAARAGEVEGATWGEIVGDSWIIPAERMKARKVHRVPLTPQAVALLGERRSDGTPLFKLASNSMLNAIKAAHGKTMHGMRSTFKTWGAEAGKDRELIERSLAHSFGEKVEKAYLRSDLLERRRALLMEWADFVTGRKLCRV